MGRVEDDIRAMLGGGGAPIAAAPVQQLMLSALNDTHVTALLAQQMISASTSLPITDAELEVHVDMAIRIMAFAHLRRQALWMPMLEAAATRAGAQGLKPA